MAAAMEGAPEMSFTGTAPLLAAARSPHGGVLGDAAAGGRSDALTSGVLWRAAAAGGGGGGGGRTVVSCVWRAGCTGTEE